LIPVSDALIAVTDEQVERMERDFDTNDVMRASTNRILELARRRSPDIEGLHDIDAHLVENPCEDALFAKFYEDSGYLTAWEAEFIKNRWQYDVELLGTMPGEHAQKRAYCVGVLQDHGDMLSRRDENRAGYVILYHEHGLQTFAKLKRLYEKLVDLQIARRAVALQWLELFAPDALPGSTDADTLVPHTDEWFAVLSRQNPQQATLVRNAIAAAVSIDVCSFCGDGPALNYRLINALVQRDTVLTAKLCDDCRVIRRHQYGEAFELLG